MKRLIFVYSLLAVSLLPGCVNVQVNQISADAPRVTHIVVCWLKEPGNAEHRQQLINESRGLARIPGVVHVSAGSVLPTTRPAVDASFDVAVVMKFRDEEALKNYAEHPIHLEAVDRTLRPLVAKYVVYDYRE